jgi:S-adenosylmethionine:tRNA ribosyltransferase-isomerase
MRDLHSASAYDYRLPDGLIAVHPVEPRSASRLLELRGDALRDCVFAEIADLLEPGDLLVVNDARVAPVRLEAKRPSGGNVEVFVVGFGDEGRWDDPTQALVAMIRSNRRVPVGETLDLCGYALHVIARDGKFALCELEANDAWGLIAELGAMPLPPYIRKRRRDLDQPEDQPDDRERYQTIFARSPGAVAAPTAGLHFDPTTLAALAARGVELAQVTLHVGVGTFAPVQVERLDAHEMHVEHYEITPTAASAVNNARDSGRRVVAVGTTVVRTLEAAFDNGRVVAGAGATDLFIRPGYRFEVIDALVTNFHLPRSTLLALVAAFCGYDRVMSAYAHAVEHGYRFYSYGDAMFTTKGAK